MKCITKSNVLLVLSVLSIAVSLYLVFLYAPTEKTMGNVQRIFYFHVSSAWVSFLAFGVTCYASVAFLMKKDLKWDKYANASAGIGLLLCTITLITGSLWARPVWGIWWTWDARLTTTLILWLIYLSYSMLRSYIDVELKRAYLSAVVGIIGFVNVILVYFSIRLWTTQHPSPVIGGGDGSGLESTMLFTLLFCIFSFTVFYSYLLVSRKELEDAVEEVEYLQKLAEQ
jgi:heme exporter protein C